MNANFYLFFELEILDASKFIISFHVYFPLLCLLWAIFYSCSLPDVVMHVHVVGFKNLVFFSLTAKKKKKKGSIS